MTLIFLVAGIVGSAPCALTTNISHISLCSMNVAYVWYEPARRKKNKVYTDASIVAVVVVIGWQEKRQ